jgi:lipopolysaccharide export LptBFGC system permease protein LptF
MVTLSRMCRDGKWLFGSPTVESGFLLQPCFASHGRCFAGGRNLSSLSVWPWANQQRHAIRHQQRSDLDVWPQVSFRNPPLEPRFFFIDRNSNAQQDSSNVFIAANEKAKFRHHCTVRDASKRAKAVNFSCLKTARDWRNEIGNLLKNQRIREYGTHAGDSNDLNSHPKAKLLSTRI